MSEKMIDAEVFERTIENDKEWRRYMLLKVDNLHDDQRKHAGEMTRLRTTMDNFMGAELPARVGKLEGAVSMLRDKMKLRTTILVGLGGALPVIVGFGVWLVKTKL